MTELLGNAWMGWQQFTTTGKSVALLIASLLFLWLSGRWKANRSLFVYTALMTLCCIVPVTAAVLMLYQTRFYNYEWIWSLVPMTAVTAWAGTEFLGERWQGFKLTGWRKGLPVTALLLAVIVLCGGMGRTVYDGKSEKDGRVQAREVLQTVTRQQGPVCLWAPREILEYTREIDPSIQVLYGRNMWDAALGAYTYDAYSQEMQDLYLWMENVDETGDAVVTDAGGDRTALQGESCVCAAAEAGAECVLLPGHIEPETADKLAAAFGGSISRVDGYYLLTR